MKKIIIAGLCCVLVGSRIFAGCENDATKAKPDPMVLTTAIMGIAGELLNTLPGLIQDIVKFPGLAQADAIALQNGMKAAAVLVGAAKQKKVNELFIDGVNLTILVTNILNKLIIMISKIGPLAEAIDPVNGAKVDDALELTATIMQMISKINVAMKNSIIASGTITVSDQAKITPKIDPVPDL